MDERRRVLTHSGRLPYTVWTPSVTPGSPLIRAGVLPPITSIESTKSRGHAWPQAGPAKTDVGGDFTTQKIVQLYNFSPRAITSRTKQDAKFIGTQWAVNPSDAIAGALALVTPSSDISLMTKGTTAIARCIPTNPVADAGTFIGELKSGLPKLVGRELFKTKFKDYRKVGGEYLNVEFGWKPLISDLQKFGTAAIESNKILEQLYRDSGKNIRRKYTFPDEIVNTQTVSFNRLAHLGVPGVSDNVYYSATGGQLTIATTVTTKTWFSGCFTYHLNLGNTLPDRMARTAAEARKLFGVELTPETVWNLAPWSWAVDWEGNVGDVLHNVSRFSQDGLVMRYGYIMQSKTAEVTYSLDFSGTVDNGSPRNSGLHLKVIAQSKTRRRATPFGFGFDMTALTGRQSAILGALGISRGPRHL
jgi:hypothetical protein